MQDSLIANAPAVHSELRSMHSSVKHLDHKLDATADAIKELKNSSGECRTTNYRQGRVHRTVLGPCL